MKLPNFRVRDSRTLSESQHARARALPGLMRTRRGLQLDRRISGVFTTILTKCGHCANTHPPFFLGFPNQPKALRGGRVASIAVCERRVRSDARVLSSLRIPGAVR